MTQRGYQLESVITAPPEAGSVSRFCAYNQSRSRFLCPNIEAGEFPGDALDAQLLLLTPDSTAGLWLLPYRDIPPTSLSVPIDLVYLDQNHMVLETVESFPLALPSTAMARPASALIFPADSVSATGTQPGDQLVLCPPGEMKRRLKEQSTGRADVRAAQLAPPVEESPKRPGSHRLLRWEDHLAGRSGADGHFAHDDGSEQSEYEPIQLFAQPRQPKYTEAAQQIQPVTASESTSGSAGEQAAEPPQLFSFMQKKEKHAKSWFHRILAPAPSESRRAARESIRGLVAHFFTGGFPCPHEVRDISEKGVYVFTRERWYPGTVVRVTLTCSLVPGSECSITLNSSVVRGGDDGVGLEFVLPDAKDRNWHMEGMATGAGRAEVEQFLRRLRIARGLVS